jgi:hypothetical protein
MTPDSPSTRTRRDGRTAHRQADFLGMQAETGSVIGGREVDGMSRKSAGALRARPEAGRFAAAWDAALGAPVRKVTVADLHFRARHGLIQPVLFRRRSRGMRGKVRLFRASAAVRPARTAGAGRMLTSRGR